MIAKRLSAALLLAVLPSCLALLRTGKPDDVDEQAQEYLRDHGPDGYVVEGEVRDFATFALARDAVVDTSSDVPGYRPKAHVDDRGHFHVAIVIRQKRNNFAQQMINAIAFGDAQAGEIRVREVGFRARSGTRCSPIFRSLVEDLPQRPMVLWLQACTEKELARLP